METFGVKFKPTLHLIFVGAFMFEQAKCLIISSKIVFDKCLLLTDVCSSYHERGNKEKRLSPHDGIKPQIPRSDALPLSHRDSTVSWTVRHASCILQNQQQ